MGFGLLVLNDGLVGVFWECFGRASGRCFDFLKCEGFVG